MKLSLLAVLLSTAACAATQKAAPEHATSANASTATSQQSMGPEPSPRENAGSVTMDAQPDPMPRADLRVAPQAQARETPPRAAAAPQKTAATTAPAPGAVPPRADSAPSTAVPAPSGPTVLNRAGGADGTDQADNTRVNQRDRAATVTPMDQGNSKEELKITATIRQGLMKNKALSFTAKNVKVVTVGTRVTLRGPVVKEEERAAIESVARSAPGVREVDNQLEVKN